MLLTSRNKSVSILTASKWKEDVMNHRYLDFGEPEGLEALSPDRPPHPNTGKCVVDQMCK